MHSRVEHPSGSPEPAAHDRRIRILRCPQCGGALSQDATGLVCTTGDHRYPSVNGIPDLRCPPPRLTIDVEWYEPWEQLERMAFSFPERLEADDLPYHLDAYQAAIAGPDGSDRRLLEIGCAARHCEPYFAARGFEYVGLDCDIRGRGPHVLGDAHNLPFSDGSFDLYYAMSVYEHLTSPLTAALEAHRVLKPGGVIFGSAAFVYGLHDRASFFHMTAAGQLCVLRSAGFRNVRLWPGWRYWQSIPNMAFKGPFATPWRWTAMAALAFAEWTFAGVSNVARRLVGREALDRQVRHTHTAGGINFAATKPGISPCS